MKKIVLTLICFVLSVSTSLSFAIESHYYNIISGFIMSSGTKSEPSGGGGGDGGYSSTLTNGLIAYISFDGNTVTNTAGGITVHTDSPEIESPDALTFTNGVLDEAAAFVDNSRFVSFTTNIITNGSFSISAWALKNAGGDDSAVFANNGQNINGELTFALFAGGSVPYFVSHNQLTLSASTTISPDTWNHYVVTYSGTGTAKFYVNGVDETSVESENSEVVADTTFPQTIGFDRVPVDVGVWNNRWFNGLVDDFAVWNRELTESEVTNLYNGGSGLQVLPN